MTLIQSSKCRFSSRLEGFKRPPIRAN